MNNQKWTALQITSWKSFKIQIVMFITQKSPAQLLHRGQTVIILPFLQEPPFSTTPQMINSPHDQSLQWIAVGMFSTLVQIQTLRKLCSPTIKSINIYLVIFYQQHHYNNIACVMKVAAVRQLVSRAILGLVMVLVGYESNDKRLRVWERVEWMVSYSYCKHLHDKQFSEFVQ